jgi:hypothetical protein
MVPFWCFIVGDPLICFVFGVNTLYIGGVSKVSELLYDEKIKRASLQNKIKF